MQCKSIVSKLKGCNFCVINIPCHCTVLTQTNNFLPHVASCDSINPWTCNSKIWFNYSINTNVYLKITNGQTCIDIKALNIPLCLSHWHVQPPIGNEDIKVIGTFRPKLTVSWSDFLFTSKLNPGSLQVPGIINISY